MRIVPMAQLLKKAKTGKYAVPAFNICNMEFIQNILVTANSLRSPVIIMAHYSEMDYAGEQNVVAMVNSIGAGMDLDVAVHLDHGDTFSHVMRAIHAGFSSVMYDGSTLPLEENIRNLRKAAEAAHAAGVTVEGEIGTIGATTEFGDAIENAHLTDPQAAKRLVEESGVDCLAVAIGNAHGVYVEEPKLDLERLAETHRLVDLPLVLHGGTGIPVEQIQKAIGLGIAKVNFGTVLRLAFVGGMKAFMAEDPDNLSLMEINAAGSVKMRAAVADCIQMCMSANQLP